MLRICLDANVLLRAVAAPAGPQAELLRRLLTDPEIESVISADIAAEWRANALKPSVQRYFSRRGVDARRYEVFVETVIDASTLIVPTGSPPECRDEDDRKYLHLAATVAQVFVVTADMDLLLSEAPDGATILSAWEMLGLLAADDVPD